jgi:curved DNA-binding protein CbpA
MSSSSETPDALQHKKLYEILEVGTDATSEEIKRSYR